MAPPSLHQLAPGSLSSFYLSSFPNQIVFMQLPQQLSGQFFGGKLGGFQPSLAGCSWMHRFVKWRVKEEFCWKHQKCREEKRENINFCCSRLFAALVFQEDSGSQPLGLHCSTWFVLWNGMNNYSWTIKTSHSFLWLIALFFPASISVLVQLLGRILTRGFLLFGRDGEHWRACKGQGCGAEPGEDLLRVPTCLCVLHPFSQGPFLPQ